MGRPVLIDLFCGAGGASMGYWRAGFRVIGVDREPQPHYPFEFRRGNALYASLRYADAVHASPPCQAYSVLNSIHARRYPDLIGPVREVLVAAGVPWVIENVERAPLVDPVLLCGTMFGLRVFRHRMFESSVSLVAPPHPGHDGPGQYYSVTGHGDSNWQVRLEEPHREGPGYTNRARAAMGINWMRRGELAEAIPPAYTEWIGAQLLAAVSASARKALTSRINSSARS